MRSTRSLAKPSTCLLLPLVLAASMARSAPASSEELNGLAETTGSATGALHGANAGANSPGLNPVPQSKTVELLLQLQDQPNALAGEGRSMSDSARRRLGVTAASSSATGQAVQVDETNLAQAMRAAVLRDAAPRHAENETDATQARRDDFSDRSGSGLSGQATAPRRDPGESLLSNPVIRYIRENRTAVIGVSLGILAAVWLTANFSLRRSR